MCYAAALAMLLDASQHASPPPASNDLDLLRAVADAADENRAKFPFGSIHFRFQDGRARNLDEAKAGTMSDSHEARCFYAYHDAHAIYEKRFSLTSMTARTVWTSKYSSTSSLRGDRLLTNGKLTLIETIGSSRDGKSEVYGHVIAPGTDEFYVHVKIPLSLGIPNAMREDVARFNRIVLEGTPGSGIEAIDPDAVLDGIKVVKIALRAPRGKGTVWVDLERGAIPLRMHQEIPISGSIDIYNGQIRHIPGHGWLPFEETVFLQDGTTRRTLIDRAEFDKPPGPEVFRMAPSIPTGIGNLAAGVSYKPQSFYDLDNLPSASSGQTRPMKMVPKEPGPEAKMPGEREPPRRYFTIAAIAGLVVVAMAYRRLRR